MKKTALLIVLIFSTMTTFAQNTTNQISVNGIHKFSVKPEYRVSVVISMQNVYYDTENTNVTELKKAFYDKLNKIGISSNRLQENEMKYDLLGYEKDGTIIEFKTTSMEEFQKFLNTKSLGLSKLENNAFSNITVDKMAEYSNAAFADAKKKATAIAQKLGKKLGEVKSYVDNNSLEIEDSLYYNNTSHKKTYLISVSFELL